MHNVDAVFCYRVAWSVCCSRLRAFQKRLSRSRLWVDSTGQGNHRVLIGATWPRASAGCWLGGSMPPCRLRRKKLWKFDYEMVHLKYIWICGQHSAVLYTCFHPHPIQKTALFCMFSLFIFSSIFPGGSADPICPYMRTPMHLANTMGRYLRRRRWCGLCLPLP